MNFAQSIFAIVRRAQPTIAYHALYSAKVVHQGEDRATVDVVPDDARLPPMSKVPLKLGIPGATAKIENGARVLVGWENGDPQRAYAALFEKGATTLVLSLNAAKIELGGEALVLPKQGVVNGEAIDSYTGMPQWMLGNASTIAGAKKQ